MDDYKKYGFFGFFKRLLLVLVASAALFILYIYGGQKYENDRDLSYSAKSKWEWHDEYNRIQIKRKVDGFSMLRRVYPEKNYAIYAEKGPNYQLRAYVKFITNCIPDSEIETSRIFKGHKIKLYCSSDGDYLFHGSSWSLGSNPIGYRGILWEDDLDGFSFRESFSSWDFSVLDQEITLSKQKKGPNDE